MRTKLKPCPLCGGNHVDVETDCFTVNDERGISIRCQDCGCMIDPAEWPTDEDGERYEEGTDDFEDTLESVICVWNSRQKADPMINLEQGLQIGDEVLKSLLTYLDLIGAPVRASKVKALRERLEKTRKLMAARKLELEEEMKRTKVSANPAIGSLTGRVSLLSEIVRSSPVGEASNASRPVTPNTPQDVAADDHTTGPNTHIAVDSYGHVVDESEDAGEESTQPSNSVTHIRPTNPPGLANIGSLSINSSIGEVSVGIDPADGLRVSSSDVPPAVSEALRAARARLLTEECSDGEAPF